jgi:putative ABC transport system substrate-binding protein
LAVDLTAKRLEILREIVPKLRRIITFYDPRTPGGVTSFAAAREAAGKLDIEVAAQQVTSPGELRDRLRALTATEAEAFFFIADFLVIVHAPLVIERATALRLPTMATHVDFVRMGALAGYGPDFREYGRSPARYAARILAGSLPRDLPVEAINRPGLAINLKTAKALDLTIPPGLCFAPTR